MIPSSPEGHYAILLAKNGVRSERSQASRPDPTGPKVSLTS